MNYKDSVLYITHLHEIARQFETEKEALEIAGELNVGRPEGLRAFRVESCGECKRFNVRPGKNVFVKTNP